jgi:hypothetical protein
MNSQHEQPTSQYKSKAEEAYAKHLDAVARMKAAERRGDMEDAQSWKLRAADFLADMNAADRETDQHQIKSPSINPTDRELLELAAKAADIDIRTWSNCQTGGFLDPECLPEQFDRFWNPLSYNGDALYLAVRLGLVIDAEGTTSSAANITVFAIEKHNGDAFAATRRAIVRAAAEIGKSMP